jgi:UbiA prenyltransferase family.
VSIAVVAMTIITGKYFDVNVNNASVFLGLSTFVSYNGIRFLKYRNDFLKINISRWFKGNINMLLVLNITAIIGLFYFVRSFDAKALIYLIPFAIFTFLYMFPVFKINDKTYTLRKLPGVKIFCISISWSGLVVLFAFVTANMNLELKHLLFFIHQFLFVIVLTLPFDIRDVDFDSIELKTLPLVLGIKATKIFGVLLLVMMNCISFFYLIT